jgi:hypothetical protein
VVVLDERLETLATLKLAAGGHHSFEEGVCVMEAVAWIAGEPFSDHPKCASPVIATFMRQWNDDLDDDGRQMLKPLIPKLVGTAVAVQYDAAGRKVEDRRGWMCADWLVRVHTPAWLELAGCVEAATALRALPELRTLWALKKARPVIEVGRAAGAAAWAAAGAATRAATRAAALAATGAAAGAATRAAAGAAAGAATGAALRAALVPTKQSLQASAIELVERMCELR